MERINGSRAKSLIADCTCLEINDEIYYVLTHDIVNHGSSGKFEEVYRAVLRDGKTVLYSIDDSEELGKLREGWLRQDRNLFKRDIGYQKYLVRIVKTKEL